MTDYRQKMARLLGDIDRSLVVLAQTGLKELDCSAEHLRLMEGWRRKPVRRESLETVRADLGDCRRCGLSKRRTTIVFGEGNPGARLVLVGEAPGFEEDQRGEPFVGPAGELLTKIMAAIKLSRDQVYICNIVKCRPPDNRTPRPDEISTCRPFIERQLAAIRPDFVCALGAVAARALLDTMMPISQLRGQFHAFQGMQLMPTFHPAYLLRNPDKKREVWADMKMLAAAMSIEIS